MKTGFITIIGRPNVGKSTLLNAIIGEKIAIVTDKPQTTRSRIVGIYNEEDVQFIFVDTPGLHTPKNKLGEYMVKEAYEAADDVDCAIVVTEPKPPKATEVRLIERFNKDGIPMILVVNKTDKYSREEVAKTIAEYAKLSDFASVVPTSALRGSNVSIIIDELKKIIEDGGEKFYPDDIATDQTVRHMAAEIIREKLMRRLSDEIPHGITVDVVSFKEREDKPITDIAVSVICERESHKRIVIGKNGALIKAAASEARKEIEDLLDGKVFLECFVKVREGWRDDNNFINNNEF